MEQFSFKQVIVLLLSVASLSLFIVGLGIAIRVFGYQQIRFLVNSIFVPNDIPNNFDTLSIRWSVCQKKGGRWVSSPGSSGECLMPTLDEGKNCYQQSECFDICEPTGKQDASGYFLGRCTLYHPTICQDSIPFKTRNKDDFLYFSGRSCI
jgi:hypothetical protein